MLLFNPSPGQIADRMHILSLKQDAAQKRGADISALKEEYRICQETLVKRMKEIDFDEIKLVKFSVFSEFLRRQNQSQWESEDALHSMLKTLPENPTYDMYAALAKLAKKTHLGNEYRSKLVADIDELFGEIPERKTYL